MKARIHLTGQRFGRYVVLEEAQRRTTNRYWRCRCDCGEVREVPQGTLLTRQAQSCGCLQREWVGQAKPARTHGRTKTVEYSTWQNMKRRCHDPGFAEYARYGGRGIYVYGPWRESFERFLADVGERPAGCTSLERKDNDGPYVPGNVRWATPEEQANNRRSNTRLTLNGRTQSLSRWCKELGVRHYTVMSRIARGWSVEQALLTPVRKWERKP